LSTGTKGISSYPAPAPVVARGGFVNDGVWGEGERIVEGSHRSGNVVRHSSVSSTVNNIMTEEEGK